MADLMGYIDGTSNVQVFDADKNRLKDLAAELTQRGPGRFGQRETIRYLLDEREALLSLDQYDESEAS